MQLRTRTWKGSAYGPSRHPAGSGHVGGPGQKVIQERRVRSVGQVGEGIQPVFLGGFYQAVDDGAGTGPTDRIGKQPVLDARRSELVDTRRERSMDPPARCDTAKDKAAFTPPVLVRGTPAERSHPHAEYYCFSWGWRVRSQSRLKAVFHRPLAILRTESLDTKARSTYN